MFSQRILVTFHHGDQFAVISHTTNQFLHSDWLNEHSKILFLVKYYVFSILFHSSSHLKAISFSDCCGAREPWGAPRQKLHGYMNRSFQVSLACISIVQGLISQLLVCVSFAKFRRVPSSAQFIALVCLFNKLAQ